MSRLEYIRRESFTGALTERGDLNWKTEGKKPIDGLPQIFWEDGRGWSEVNIWALDRYEAESKELTTIKRGMKHLNNFATFIEDAQIDWRHFPMRKQDQVLTKFRKYLIDEMMAGRLENSTATNCMNTVIQFYRFANVHDLVGVRRPLWNDRLAVIPYFDSHGFKRTVLRISSDLSIPNGKRIGARVEDGLLPLRASHMSELLEYTAKHAIEELHRMLSVGFFTGARVGTITTMTVTGLDSAFEDSQTQGLYSLQVGPGTGIATKFSVRGAILIPKAVLEELKAYANSTARKKREAKALPAHKNLLFLNRKGRPYTVESVDRLVWAMRARAVSAGLQFAARFKFHQSRATFGTWLMQILLDCGIKTSDAIGFVRDAMLHKDERTTWLYITFLENTRGKQEAASKFNTAFTGVRQRDWAKINA